MKSIGRVLGLTVALALIAVSWYAKSHPASLVSYVLFSLHIRVFEPNYSARRKGVELMDGFFSYSSMDDVESNLRSKGLSWHRDPPQRPRRDLGRRPDFIEEKLVVNAYAHLTFPGELRLHFLNDRLSSVVFFPQDITSYFAALERFERAPIPGPMSAYTGEKRNVYRSIAVMEKREFAGWRDLRFIPESAAWVMRYS